MERDFVLYLEDMLQSIEKIGQYLTGIDFDTFIQNSMITDAVIRNFKIIGEAANCIPENIKDKYPDVPWSKMY